MPITALIYSEVIDHGTGTCPVRPLINSKLRKIPKTVTLESVLFYRIKRRSFAPLSVIWGVSVQSPLYGERGTNWQWEKKKKGKSQGTCVVCQNRFLMVPLIFTTWLFTNLYEPYKECILAACFGLHFKACSALYPLILNRIASFFIPFKFKFHFLRHCFCSPPFP